MNKMLWQWERDNIKFSKNFILHLQCIIHPDMSPSMFCDLPVTEKRLIKECFTWSQNSKMQLHASKTKTINISLSNNSHVVDTVDCSELLGVADDVQLNFTQHI